MKVVSFNINGLRSRLHQLQALIDTQAPDIIGLQETKVHDEAFPLADVEAMGYKVYYHGGKAHYGVALLSKVEPESVEKGYPWDAEDAQRRMIIGKFRQPSGRLLTVMNGYFPQGESRDHEIKFPAKRKFYADLQRLLTESYSSDDDIIIMGDINISPLDLDIGIGPDNAKRWLRTGKCSFLPEEREWLQTLKDWGLYDNFRVLHPEQEGTYSWFDYRSKGFDDNRGLRIDVIMTTRTLTDRLIASGVDYHIRAMEKPSDHAPVWSEFE
ncbi:exodeoxyribonuclease III [Shewanella litorisediminis]|uniref:Exodeoxyribonuclease III n=1 Tax=Shewanella litorisediminis TaxID=1173586 RepID=A0ABX7FZF5_9GAMM|nr:exodeoxyribonuclease III [Shewanella litorisediminis]MCL2919546.1 exodeoxyribonuclease III [Shewanella litorisediminis]QRH00418.1 exodeoxyribonuclease III [Shewanella litorisediminis]